MYLKHVHIVFLVAFAYVIFTPKVFFCKGDKIRYISTEHPNITYIESKYIKYINLTSQRYNRQNPFYYVGLHFESLVAIDHHVSIDFYFYELLTNVYKRSFVEMHFKLCDMLRNDRFFGAAMKQGKFAKPCPYPPGKYHLYNMTIDVGVIPPGFPFRKGRIYCNVSSSVLAGVVMMGYIDMEIKEYSVKRLKKHEKLRFYQE